MNVIVAGELPLVEEITQLAVAADYNTNTYLVEDFLSAVQNGFVLQDTSDMDVANSLALGLRER